MGGPDWNAANGMHMGYFFGGGHTIEGEGFGASEPGAGNIFTILTGCPYGIH